MQKLKAKFKTVKTKQAGATIGTSIKVITSIVLAALIIVGLSGVITNIVLPNTNNKVSSMFAYKGNDGGGPGDGSFGGGTGAPEDVPTVEELQETYEFTYYSSMLAAVTDVNNGTAGENFDAEQSEAVAGIYTDEEGKVNVVLLRDNVEISRLKPSVDMVINLGGNTLSTTDTVCIDSLSGVITLDGRLEGSAISMSSESSAAGPFQIRAGTFTINGGTYTSNVNITGGQNLIASAANVTINNAKLEVTNTAGAVRCIQSNSGLVTITDTVLIATANSTAQAYGFSSKGDAVLSNVKITAANLGNGSCYGIVGYGNLSLTNSEISTTGATFSEPIANEGSAKISNTILKASGSGQTGGIYNALETSSLELDNVNIVSNGTSAEKITYGITNFGTVTAQKVDIRVTAYSTVAGLYSESGNVQMSNSVIRAESSASAVNTKDVSIYGIYNTGTSTANISDTTVVADGPFLDAGSKNSVDEGNFDSCPIGLVAGSNSTTTLTNCNIKGYHSGVSAQGSINVDGGTYEGYSHGGFYFSGANTTSYVKNANIRGCEKYSSYEDDGALQAGFYIGGNTGKDNITVYMNNCDIYGYKQPIVLRGSSNEKNNSLYISNSTINKGSEYGVRVDNTTHRLYLGQGNNFDINDLWSHITADEAAEIVVVTNEVYCQ